MSPRSFALRAGVFALLLLVVGKRAGASTTHDHDEFREDVLSCEEALAHLESCCPAFDPSRLACRYSYDLEEASCDHGTETLVLPDLSLDQSRCIREMTCRDLVAHGVCERAMSSAAGVAKQACP